MNKKNVVTSIGYGLLLIDLIVIFIFQNNNKIVLFSIAAGMLICGIISILKNSVIGYIITCLSVSLTVSGLLFFCKVFDVAKAFTFMISSSVAALMLITLIFSIYKKKVIDSEYALTIEAEVIELISNPNTEAKFYQPLYRYEIEGHQYTVPYPGFINKKVPRIGERQLIRVDKKDNQNVYFDKKPMDKVIDYLLIIFFLVVSIIIMIGQFR